MQAVLYRQHRSFDRTRHHALKNLGRRRACRDLQLRIVAQHRKRRHVAVGSKFALDCDLHRQPPGKQPIDNSFRPTNWQPHFDPTQLIIRMAVVCFSQPKAEGIAGQIQEERMLWTITVVLFILWLVGMVSSYTMGGWIHILLVLAIIMII